MQLRKRKERKEAPHVVHRKRRRKQHSAMMPDNRITYITDLVPLDLWMYICNAIYIPDSGNNCTLAQVLALLHYTADPHAAIEMFYSQAAQPDLVVLHPRSTQWPDGGYECMNRNGLMRFCSGIVAANTTQDAPGRLVFRDGSPSPIQSGYGPRYNW